MNPGRGWQRTLAAAHPNGVGQFSCHQTSVIPRGPKFGGYRVTEPPQPQALPTQMLGKGVPHSPPIVRFAIRSKVELRNTFPDTGLKGMRTGGCTSHSPNCAQPGSGGTLQAGPCVSHWALHRIAVSAGAQACATIRGPSPLGPSFRHIQYVQNP